MPLFDGAAEADYAARSAQPGVYYNIHRESFPVDTTLEE